jgi:hypothetical protein
LLCCVGTQIVSSFVVVVFTQEALLPSHSIEASGPSVYALHCAYAAEYDVSGGRQADDTRAGVQLCNTVTTCDCLDTWYHYHARCCLQCWHTFCCVYCAFQDECRGVQCESMVKIASKKVKIWGKHDAELVLPQQSASL